MEALAIRPAPVRKSLIVRADAAKAFDVFTNRMGSWWPASHSINSAELKNVVMEPKADGRWFERGADGTECQWGKVIAWEPPSRLLLAWQITADWKYDPDLVTEVEVTFTPTGNGETRVELEHRNLERYGGKAEAVRLSIDSDGGWRKLLELFAEAVSA
jgi:uncharacterized protein YndB with AHSA1/START domain